MGFQPKRGPESGVPRVRPRGARRLRAVNVAGLMAVIAAMSVGTSAAAASQRSPRAATRILKVAYSSTYVFDTNTLASRFFHGIAKQFDQQNPGYKVQLVPIPGDYNNIVTKESLMFRSASTAPDIVELATGESGVYAASDFLLPLNKYLNHSTWWKNVPQIVRENGTQHGQVYTVDQGDNTTALFYNKVLFRKAGLPVPWHPTSWAAIIAAAKKIKRSLPGVIPFWMIDGSASGAMSALFGFNNLLYGTKTPQIQVGDKWVVDSPGIRDVLGFFKSIYSAGLGTPASQVFSPNAATVALPLFANGKLAMGIGSNYYSGNWTKAVGAPYWKAAPRIMGITALPNMTGGGSVTTVGGWALGIGAHTKYPQAAFKLLSLMEGDVTNSINQANWIGLIPPNSQAWRAPGYLKFAPGQRLFAKLLANAHIVTPSSANYPVWVQGMNNATGAIVQNPSTSVSSAVNQLKSYVTNQLGADKTTTIK